MTKHIHIYLGSKKANDASPSPEVVAINVRYNPRA